MFCFTAIKISSLSAIFENTYNAEKVQFINCRFEPDVVSKEESEQESTRKIIHLQNSENQKMTTVSFRDCDDDSGIIGKTFMLENYLPSFSSKLF